MRRSALISVLLDHPPSFAHFGSGPIWFCTSFDCLCINIRAARILYAVQRSRPLEKLGRPNFRGKRFRIKGSNADEGKPTSASVASIPECSHRESSLERASEGGIRRSRKKLWKQGWRASTRPYAVTARLAVLQESLAAKRQARTRCHRRRPGVR